MQNYNITDFANDYGEVIRSCRKWESVIFSLSFVLVGSAICVSPRLFEILNQSLIMACIIVGVSMICVGVVVALFQTTELRYLPTDSPIFVRYSYKSPRDLCKIEQMLRNANIALGSPANIQGAGQLRIDTMTSADKQICMCMVFQYVPYNYLPLYGPYVVTAELAERIAN